MKSANAKQAGKKSGRKPGRKLRGIIIAAAAILVLASILAITIIKLNEKENIKINATAKSQPITGFVLYSGLAELQLSKAIVMAATLIFAATIIGVFIIKTREIRRLQLHKPKHGRKRR